MDEMNETMGATVVANEETTIPMEVENNGLSAKAIAGIAAGGGIVVGVAITYIPKAVRWVKNKIAKRKLAALEDEIVENDL